MRSLTKFFMASSLVLTFSAVALYSQDPVKTGQLDGAAIEERISELAKEYTKLSWSNPKDPEINGLLKQLEALPTQASEPGGDKAMQALLVASYLHNRMGNPETAVTLARRVETEGDSPQTRNMGRLGQAELALESGDEARILEVQQRMIADGGDVKALAQLERVLSMVRLAPGKPFPGFNATDLEGKPMKVADYAGKVVLVQFFATWCGPCMAEVPHLKKAVETYGDKGFTVLAISLDRERSDLTNWVDGADIPWRIALDEGGSIASSFAIVSIPDGFLVDEEGNIIARGLRHNDLMTTLEQQLGS